MQNKLKRMGQYLAFFLLSNTLYGTLLYLTVTNLAKISLLYAYLGNLALIFLGLALDTFILRKSASTKALSAQLRTIKNAKEKEQALRQIRWYFRHWMSFKTSLFLFYIAVLLLSQILRFYPGLVGEEFATFISTIDYSILVLLAFKDFGEEFAKDKDNAKKLSEEFEACLAEQQE